MSILRNDQREVRLWWRLILVIVLYVAAEILFRFIPIKVLSAILVGQGIPQNIALERASEIVFDDPGYSTAICILIGLMGLLIVWFLVRVIEKNRFTWKMVGLDWRRDSLPFMLLGAILGLLNVTGSLLIGKFLDSNAFSSISARIDGSANEFFQLFLLFLARAFGEEIVFRGYIQSRLVDQYKAFWGISITAIVFVFLHQISYGLSPVLVLSGVMLWSSIGVLYHFSKSLYLVILIHAVMNTLINAFRVNPGDIANLIVNALSLSLVIVVAVIVSRKNQVMRNIT